MEMAYRERWKAEIATMRQVHAGRVMRLLAGQSVRRSRLTAARAAPTTFLCEFQTPYR